MLFAALGLSALYFLFLIIEKRRNDRALSSFRYVIHVNGTRGKTEVCRLLDAVFRAAGFRVFTKTTGTTPFYLDTDGTEHQIHRHGPSNISEQLRMIRKAARNHANVLILECMAVSPELQRVAQKEIVKGNFNVITNVRYDHIFEMGETLPEIATALSSTIPEGGTFLSSDEDFFPFFADCCQKSGTQAHLCRPAADGESENEAIAHEAARILGLSEEAFRSCLKTYPRDFGAHLCYRISGSLRFLSLFSANDPQSSALLLRSYHPDQYDHLVFLYHNRFDRPDRLLLFIRYFLPHFPFERLYVSGEQIGFALRLLRQNGFVNCFPCRGIRGLLSEYKDRGAKTLLVGIGNIKGEAYQVIEAIEKEGISHE